MSPVGEEWHRQTPLRLAMGNSVAQATASRSIVKQAFRKKCACRTLSSMLSVRNGWKTDILSATMHCRMIQIALFLFGSLTPLLFLVGGCFAFRRLNSAPNLVLNLIVLLISAPLGARIIDQGFPPLPGAHLHSENPGQAVIYLFLAPVWLSCLAGWLAWVGWTAAKALKRKYRPTR